MMPPEPRPYGQPVPAGSTRRTFGVAGTVTAVIGAVLVVIAFTAVDWTKAGNSSFSDVHDVLDRAGSAAAGLADAYFGWLGWVTLAVVFVVAILANLPTTAASALRPLGLLLALVAIGLTFWSIKLLSTSRPSYLDYLRDQRIGFYLTCVGFLLIGIGSLLGPTRRPADAL